MRALTATLVLALLASACTAADFGLYTNPCPQGDSVADREEIKRLRNEDGVNCVRVSGNSDSSPGSTASVPSPTASKNAQTKETAKFSTPMPTIDSGPRNSTYTFREDDTLWSIAERFLGSGSRWPEIAELNRIGNPNEIPNGLILLLPDSGSTSQDSASCSTDEYRNVDGRCVRRPTASSASGYSARCQDGTFSFSKNRQGTCSHHGGVASWG